MNRKNLKEWQEKVEGWFEKSESKKWPKFVTFARVIEEIGEIGKSMNVKEGFQKKEVSELKDEFGDALFTFMSLANQYNIDLDEAMGEVIKKYDEYID